MLKPLPSSAPSRPSPPRRKPTTASPSTPLALSIQPPREKARKDAEPHKYDYYYLSMPVMDPWMATKSRRGRSGVAGRPRTSSSRLEQRTGARPAVTSPNHRSEDSLQARFQRMYETLHQAAVAENSAALRRRCDRAVRRPASRRAPPQFPDFSIQVPPTTLCSGRAAIDGQSDPSEFSGPYSVSPAPTGTSSVSSTPASPQRYALVPASLSHRRKAAAHSSRHGGSNHSSRSSSSRENPLRFGSTEPRHHHSPRRQVKGRCRTSPLPSPNDAPYGAIEVMSVAKRETGRVRWPQASPSHQRRDRDGDEGGSSARRRRLTDDKVAASHDPGDIDRVNEWGVAKRTSSERRRGTPRTTEASPRRDMTREVVHPRHAHPCPLKELAEALCKCYWSEFPDLEMSLNPASHAATCPFHDEQAAYERHLLPDEEGEDDNAMLRQLLQKSPLRIPRFGSAPKRWPSPRVTDRPASRPRDRLRSSGSGGGAREVRKEMSQVSGRAAVMGTAVRRTFLETLVADAAGAEASKSSRPRRRGSPPAGVAAAKEVMKRDEGEAEVDLPGATIKALAVPRVRPRVGVPGPGAYHTDRAYTHTSASRGARSAVMSTVDRMPANTSTSPGPGAYNTDHIGSIAEAAKVAAVAAAPLGSAIAPVRRLQNQYGINCYAGVDDIDNPTPGPGDYDLDEAWGKMMGSAVGHRFAKAVSAAHETTLSRREVPPGPGAYDVEMGIGTGGGWRGVGSGVALRLTSQRFGHQLEKTSGEPGPGTYETTRAARWMWRTAPAVSIAFRPRAFYDRGPSGLLQSTQPLADTWGGTVAYYSTPGPGTYDAHRYGDRLVGSWGPQWTFGTSVGHSSWSRDDPATSRLSSSALPGPSTYDTSAAERALQRYTSGAIMGSAPRFHLETQESGGDGEPASSSSALVGPGSYDPMPSIPRIRGGYVARAERYSYTDEVMQEAAMLPGPGTYHLPPPPLAGPTPFLGTTSPRFWMDGPGGLHSSGGLSSCTPGPGAYEVDAAVATANRPGAVIGRGPRGGLLVDGAIRNRTDDGWSLIGPGTYELPALPIGRSAVMGFAPTRRAAQPGEEKGEGVAAAHASPGPAFYDPVYPSDQATRGVLLSMTSPRFNHDGAAEERDWYPGPGAYEVGEGSSRPSRTAVFGTAQRDAAAVGTSNPIGPGSYDPYPDTGTAATHGHSIGRSARFPYSPMKDGVGPGAYEVVDMSPTGRSAVFGTAAATLSTAVGSGGPGPAAYSPEYTQVEPSPPRVLLHMTGAAHPDHLVDSINGVGPGAYDPLFPGDAGSQGPRFGTASRDPLAAGGSIGVGVSGYPGPAAYDTQVNRRGERWDMAAGGSAPLSFGTASRHLQSDSLRDGGPGPGAYEVAMGASGSAKGAVIGTAARVPPLEEPGAATAAVPGPGAYDPAAASIWPAVPAAHFGHAPRPADGFNGVDVLPGPGDYHVVNDATMASARAHRFGKAGLATEGVEALSSYPGPGAYDTETATRWLSQSTAASAAATRFGTAPRFSSASAYGIGGADTSVGPATYDVAKSATEWGGAAHHFSRAGRATDGPGGAETEVAAGPGPGTYQLDAAYRATLPRPPTAVLSTAVQRPDTKTSDATAPGPGSYSVPLGRPDGPQWGFGTAPRDGSGAIAAEAAVPGPGFYSLPPPPPTHQGVSLPQAERFRITDGSEGPGPAAYEAQTTGPQGTHGAAWSTASRFPAGDQDGAAAPGPGSYQILPPPPTHQGVSLLQAERFTSKTVSEGPGPGSYDMYAVTPHGTSGAVWGTASRFPTDDRMGANTPGPGSYSVPLGRPDGPQWGFGTAPRDGSGAIAAEAAVPGPGFYSLPPPPPTHQGVSLPQAERFRITDGSEGPGPAAYEAQTTGPQGTHGAAWSTASRFPAGDQDGAAAPGPGSYSVPSSRPDGPQWGFGTAPREDKSRADAAPGPGLYSLPPPPPMHQGVSLPQAERFRAIGDSVAPGPGSYDARTAADMRDTHVAVWGTAPRFPAYDGGSADMPGPGAYTPKGEVSSSKKGCSTVTIGQAPRVLLGGHGEHPNVGPGSYDVTRAEQKGRTMQFGTAPRMPPLEGVEATAPGPGSYATEAGQRLTMPQAPVCSIAHRLEAAGSMPGGSASPGPGAYDTTGAYGTAVGSRPAGVSILGKWQTTSPQDGVPGPGSYAVVAAASKLYDTRIGSSFGTAPRMPPPNEGGGADPGSYSLEPAGGSGRATHFSQAPRQYFATERLNMQGYSMPGPGAYDTTAATAHFGRQSPSYSIPRGPRPDLAPQDPDISPWVGPGSYYRAAYELGGREGPSFGVSERPDPVLNDNPGPGAYHRATASLSHGPSLNLAERPDPVLNDYPGPGTYYRATAPLSQGPSFPLAKRPDPVLNDNPGPGTYHRDTAPLQLSGKFIRPPPSTREDLLKKLASVGYPVLSN